MTPQLKPTKRVRERKQIRRSPPPRRSRRPNKVKKTPRGTLSRRADKLFSLIVRHPQVCTYHLDAERGEFAPLMGHGGHIQCAHLVTRGRHTVRWDEDNAMPLCGGAHKWFTHNPDAWKAYLHWKFGREAVDALELRSQAKWDGEVPLVRLAARAVALGIPSPGK